MKAESRLVQVVRATIAKHSLVTAGDTVLVAFSGGPDSTALLHALTVLAPSLGIRVRAAHIHHGLRGAEADADAAAAAAFARSLGAPFLLRRVEATAYAQTHKLSLETAAREVRYRALRAAAKRCGASRIATGHTRDDQAETVLLHLLRGSGPRGLAGIPPVRDELIRPLLAVSHAEVEDYCRTQNLPVCIDSSNASLVHLRNRIRRSLLPELRRVQPDITSALARLAEVMREEDDLISQLAEHAFHRLDHGGGEAVAFKLAELLRLPLALQRRLVRLGVSGVKGDSLDLSFARVEAVLELACTGTVGATVALTTGLVAERGYEELRIGSLQVRRGARIPERPLPLPGRVSVPEVGLAISARCSRSLKVSDDPMQARLDADMLPGPLLVRGWRAGDRLRPLGMRGMMKLQDFFVNAKVPRADRARVLIVTAGGKIAWVIGHRISDDFKVMAKTRRTVRLEAVPLFAPPEDRNDVES